MAVTTYSFTHWHGSYPYTKWDVAKGSSISDLRHYYYSLVNNNLDTGPLATFSYTATAATRSDDINRIYFTQTGTTYFQPGSMVEIQNVSPDSSVNYSGVCIGGGAGYVDYLNPGLGVSNGITGGSVRAPLHPYWTTGFAWIPGTAEVNHNQLVLRATMGDGYEQRQNPCLNSNSLRWSMVFSERTDKEARALLNFLQDKGGVGFYNLPFPVGLLYNNPNLKFTNGPAKHSLTSYGLNTVTVDIGQVFDI